MAQGFRQHGVEQLRLDGEGGCRVHGSQHPGGFGWVETFGFGFGFLIVVLFGWCLDGIREDVFKILQNTANHHGQIVENKGF